MQTKTVVAGLAALVLAAGPVVARAADGAAVYKAQCAKCHGEEGKADTTISKAMKVPPLAGDAKVAAMALPDIVKAVKDNPKHATFKEKVSAEDLEAAAAHAKTLAAGK